MDNKILKVNISGGGTWERSLLADVVGHTLQDNKFKNVVVYDHQNEPVPRHNVGAATIFDVVKMIRPQLFDALIAISVNDQELEERVFGNEHPQQPLVTDPHGTVRFKENAIVRNLLDNGPYDMNNIAIGNYSDDDRSQFAQLIGYSQGGYEELSYSKPARQARKEEEEAECTDEEMQSSFQETIGDMLRTDPSVRSMVAESFTQQK